MFDTGPIVTTVSFSFDPRSIVMIWLTASVPESKLEVVSSSAVNKPLPSWPSHKPSGKICVKRLLDKGRARPEATGTSDLLRRARIFLAINALICGLPPTVVTDNNLISGERAAKTSARASSTSVPMSVSSSILSGLFLLRAKPAWTNMKTSIKVTTKQEKLRIAFRAIRVYLQTIKGFVAMVTRDTPWLHKYVLTERHLLP